MTTQTMGCNRLCSGAPPRHTDTCIHDQNDRQIRWCSLAKSSLMVDKPMQKGAK